MTDILDKMNASIATAVNQEAWAEAVRASPPVETENGELLRLRDEHKQVGELLSYLDLHIGRYEWKVLTTEQKELMADLIDEARRAEAAEEVGRHPFLVERWWRDDFVGTSDPVGPSFRP